MKNILLGLVFMLCLPMTVAHNKAMASLFNTGDKDLDLGLEQINVEAKVDLKSFSLELSAQFSIEMAKIDMAIKIEKMEPAEVYFALELASISGKPFDTVMDIYRKNKGKGWGVIAQALGIKPGSDAFRQLKARVKVRSEKKGYKDNNKSGQEKDKSKGKK